MGYLNARPPKSVVWLKDGMVYYGDGDRVHVDHNGITFSTVLPGDSGRYIVIARNAAGIGRTFTILKGTTTLTLYFNYKSLYALAEVIPIKAVLLSQA